MSVLPGKHTGSFLKRWSSRISFLLFFTFSLLSVRAQESDVQEIAVHADHRALNELLLELSNEYGIEMSFDDHLLSSWEITADSSFHTAAEAMDYLLAPFPLEYKMIGDVYTIYPLKPTRKQRSYTVSGRIVDGKSGEALPFAHIIIGQKGVISDFKGSFSFSTPDTLAPVLLSYIGYYRKDTLLHYGDRHVLKLKASAVDLKEISILGDLLVRSGQIGDEAGVIRLNHKIAYRLPGNGDNAVFNFLRLQPGILAAGERSAEIIIWGSYTGHNRILFDGFTIFGLKNYNDNLSFVNPYMAKDIKVLKGGFGPEYENRVGGIVDISGVNGNTNKPSINLNINNMTLNGMASVPIGQNSALTFAYRATYYNLLNPDDLDFNIGINQTSVADINIRPDYHFRDANLKYAGQTKKGDPFHFSFYQGRDHFAYTVEQERKNFRIYQEALEENMQRGGNIFFGKTWRKGMNSHFSLSYSGLISGLYEKQVIERSSGNPNNPMHPNLNREVQFNNRVTELIFSNKNRIPLSPANQLEVGWNYTFEEAAFSEDSLDRELYSSMDRSDRFGLYVQDQYQPASWISITPGLRVDYPLHLQHIYLQPRIRATLKLDHYWKLNLAAGMYNQFISESSVVDALGNYRYIWTISDNQETPVLKARHLVGGLAYGNGGLTISMEGFYKTTDGLKRILYLWRSDTKEIYYGDAKMYGFDLLVKKYFGRHEAWASYTLSKTEEHFSYHDDGVYRDAPQDQRHELKGALLLNFSPFFFSSNYVYGSGFRQQSSTSTFTSERYPYHRWDIAFIYRYSLKGYQFEVGLSVLNVLNHENIKSSNLIQLPDAEAGSVSIHAEAVPFTPAIYLNMRF